MSPPGSGNAKTGNADGRPPSTSSSNASLFLERLQWWLWRTMACAREGVVVICSKEFVLHVPMLQYAERYVGQLRRLLSPTKVLSYWLPRAAACAVLALDCPDHYRCRHTAAIAYTEETVSGQATRSACEVVVRGAALCGSLCLKGFDHCESRSHACLHPCHVVVTPDEAGRGGDGAHRHCPYPCGKRLSCGHICNKDCGSDCEPCTFVGLTELTCGQRVVCGTNAADRSIQYELVHHFQEATCGAPVRLCTELVAVRCPRCGMNSRVPCFQVSAHESRELQAKSDERRHRQQQRQQQKRLTDGNGGAGSEDDDDADEANALASISFILSDGECPGCVSVYNRVAAKFGFDALPEPTVVQRLCDEGPWPNTEGDPTSSGNHKDGERAEEGDESLCAMRERATLPRHELSADAQAELRKAFVVAGKRSDLLLMKEALEISNGSASATSEYVSQKRRYETLKATQQRQIEERQQDVHSQRMAWAQRLRSEFTKQSELTADLEAMMPSLLSEALEEANRQRRYGF